MTTRISFFLIFSISLLLFLAFVPAHAQETEDVPVKTLADYQRDGVTIAALNLWKPFTFEDKTGERVGYLIDLWEKWSEKTGVPVRFKISDWPDTLKNMKSGVADIHSGIYSSEERDEYLDFSEPIQTSSAVLAIRKNGNVDCSNALVEGTVGVVNKTYAHDYLLANYPDLNIQTFPSVKAALIPFQEGQLDAIVGNYSSIATGGREGRGLGRITICRTLFYRAVRAAVAEGNENLLQIVNDGFSEISQAELNVIEDRWFVKVERKVDWLWALVPALVIFVIIAAIVFLWVGRRA